VIVSPYAAKPLLRISNGAVMVADAGCCLEDDALCRKVSRDRYYMGSRHRFKIQESVASSSEQTLLQVLLMRSQSC
jgi:hypothetical protein